MRAFSLGLIISDPHTNGLFANQHHKRTKQYNSTTDRNWPITDNLRHLSLTANNITAEPTNQFTRTGLGIFDWQLLFTWLSWLPLRLSKRQSPLPTTVLLRTTSLTIQWVPRRVQTIYYSIFIMNIIVNILIFINFCILFEFSITSNSPDCYFLLIERILNLKSRFVFL